VVQGDGAADLLAVALLVVELDGGDGGGGGDLGLGQAGAGVGGEGDVDGALLAAEEDRLDREGDGAAVDPLEGLAGDAVDAGDLEAFGAGRQLELQVVGELGDHGVELLLEHLLHLRGVGEEEQVAAADAADGGGQLGAELDADADGGHADAGAWRRRGPCP
jgi:hypothetical protein